MRFALAAALLMVTTMSGAAHEKFKIVGTVAKVHAGQLDVKSVDGSTYEMDMPDSAPVFRQNRKVAKSELEPGARVTVLALGHDFFDLEVTEVHISQ
jgi:Cu/Ag efflux protein CusF